MPYPRFLVQFGTNAINSGQKNELYKIGTGAEISGLIPSEKLKILDERSIEVLHKISNIVYETGQYPQQWLSLKFILLPKQC